MTEQLFPDRRFKNAAQFAREYQERLQYAFSQVDGKAIDCAAEGLKRAIDENRTIYVCGNGGSSAIANHIACDYVKQLGHFLNKPVRVVSLNAASELNFAVANDISFDEVFAFHIKQNGRMGDMLWTISSSGNSPNIVRAIEEANSKSMEIIAFCGFNGGASLKLATYPVFVPVENYGMVEDVHQMLMHSICQYLKHLSLEETKLGITLF